MNLKLGKRVAALRKAQKITQAQLAEYLAVQPQTISRWEAEGGLPDVALLPKIALFFGVSMDELFGMTDIERIDDLVYKYSVLRDEKSFEEVMRSIDLAAGSIEEQLRDNGESRHPELKRKREQLLAWKVHIYIQKSRKAQEEAEGILDALLQEVDDPQNPLYLPLTLQKQQFRIQKGEGRETLRRAKEDWEGSATVEHLHCYLEALGELDRGKDILRLWKQDGVRELVAPVTERTAPLWLIMFGGAAAEGDLAPFREYLDEFRKGADGQALFDAEWILAELYRTLGMQREKEESKGKLLEMLEKLALNEHIKPVYLKKVTEL